MGRTYSAWYNFSHGISYLLIWNLASLLLSYTKFKTLSPKNFLSPSFQIVILFINCEHMEMCRLKFDQNRTKNGEFHCLEGRGIISKCNLNYW